MDGKVIEGKAFWCFLYQPDIRSNPQWSLRLVPSEIEQQRFKKSGHQMNMEVIIIRILVFLFLCEEK